MTFITRASGIWSLAILCVASLQAMEVTDLKCEYRRNPLGIDTAEPRLFWVLESDVRGDRQTAWQVLVGSSPEQLKPGKADYWDSGKVMGSQSIQVAYQGKRLKSSERVFWTVRAWDGQDRPTRWAKPAWFETALLNKSDWRAQWIRHERPKATNLFDNIPAPLLRKEFVVDEKIKEARLHVAGLGMYELSMNGMRVGDHMLDPGWTAYSKRVLYSTYDVTRMLRRGPNAIGAMLGNGWYNPLPLKFWGHVDIRDHLTIGEPSLLAQLHITLEDGRTVVIGSGTDWVTTDGPLLRNNLYLGETYDARRELPGWDCPGFDDSSWRPAVQANEPGGGLHAQQAPPVRITRELAAKRVTEPKRGVFIFDFGQNFSGWVRLRVKGPAGTKIKLRYGELLYPDGGLNAMTSVAGQIKGGGKDYDYEGVGYPQTAWQQDIYVLRGDPKGEQWTPRFTFHGFRYVEVKGFPEPPELEALTGLRLNSDVEKAGSFECSDPLINKIQEMVLWTELSNLFSVQSDCPHREKFGYGGDIVVSSEMGMFNFDMAQFYLKAVRDLADSVRPNGGFTETAPFVGISDEGLGEKSGPVEWGTAHPLLQEQLYQYYGERGVILEQYSKTRKWLDLLRSSAKEGILDNGISDHESIAPKPKALTGTGFYYLNARLGSWLARMARDPGSATDLDALAEQIRSAFNNRFLDVETGRYGSGSQASQAVALYLDLAPPELRHKVLDRLVWDVTQTNKGHLTTGILGTKFMLNALTDLGREDVAWKIVTQRTFPGWGYMVENGATTLWEHWAFSDNTYSHNHPMFGSVSEWFYKALAGIRPAKDACGFDRFSLRPPSITGLDWAKADYDSIRGRISSEWRREGGAFIYKVRVPVGATAEVFLPATAEHQVIESGRPVSQTEGVTVVDLKDGRLRLKCGAGVYSFRVIPR